MEPQPFPSFSTKGSTVAEILSLPLPVYWDKGQQWKEFREEGKAWTHSYLSQQSIEVLEVPVEVRFNAIPHCLQVNLSKIPSFAGNTNVVFVAGQKWGDFALLLVKVSQVCNHMECEMKKLADGIYRKPSKRLLFSSSLLWANWGTKGWAVRNEVWREKRTEH